MEQKINKCEYQVLFSLKNMQKARWDTTIGWKYHLVWHKKFLPTPCILHQSKPGRISSWTGLWNNFSLHTVLVWAGLRLKTKLWTPLIKLTKSLERSAIHCLENPCRLKILRKFSASIVWNLDPKLHLVLLCRDSGVQTIAMLAVFCTWQYS